jgi:hypothetical protein
MKIFDHFVYLMFCVALGMGGYHYGKIRGKAEVRCPAPKVVRGTYSTEELHRILRARKRMEAVK